jgi:hypothetical protein
MIPRYGTRKSQMIGGDRSLSPGIEV